MHAFHGTQLLHCKSIVDQLGAARWAEFEAGLATLQASVHGEAEALLRQACGDAAASLDTRGTFLERRQCTVKNCINDPNPNPIPNSNPNPNPNQVNICIIGRTPGGGGRAGTLALPLPLAPTLTLKPNPKT